MTPYLKFWLVKNDFCRKISWKSTFSLSIKSGPCYQCIPNCNMTHVPTVTSSISGKIIGEIIKNYYLPCCRFDVHYFFSFVSSLHCIFYKSFILSNKKRFLFHIRPMKSKSTRLQIESSDIECQLTEFIGIPFISRDSVCILVLKKRFWPIKLDRLLMFSFMHFPFFSIWFSLLVSRVSRLIFFDYKSILGACSVSSMEINYRDRKPGIKVWT